MIGNTVHLYHGPADSAVRVFSLTNYGAVFSNTFIRNRQKTALHITGPVGATVYITGNFFGENAEGLLTDGGATVVTTFNAADKPGLSFQQFPQGNVLHYMRCAW